MPKNRFQVLLATCYLPLTIYLLSTQYVLTRPLPGCEGLLTSNYLLLTAHCLLLTTYYLLLTTYYLPGGDDGYVQGHRHPDANPRPHRHHLRHGRPRPTRTRQALLTMAPLTMALLTIAPLTIAPLTIASLTMAPLTIAPLTIAPLTMAGPSLVL